MDLHDAPEREILAAALPGAEAARRGLFVETLDAIEGLPYGEAYAALRRALWGLGGDLADLLAGAMLAAGVAGRAGVAARLPAFLPEPIPEPAPPSPGPRVDAMLESYQALPPEMRPAYLEALPPDAAARLEAASGGPPPTAELLAAAGVPGPEVHLPLIDEAVKSLRARKLMGHREFRSLALDAKANALAVAGELTRRAMARLQPILAENVAAGADPRAFRAAAREFLDESVSAAHLETTFRDAVQSSYSAGQDAILEDPVVGDSFPYGENLPIKDSRLSSMCAKFSRSGLQGTAIYRRDDPMWIKYRVPRHPNDRCGTLYMTVKMAARKGVKEAQRWLETGRPPATPEWVEPFSFSLEKAKGV